jgi:hypothetical protein
MHIIATYAGTTGTSAAHWYRARETDATSKGHRGPSYPTPFFPISFNAKEKKSKKKNCKKKEKEKKASRGGRCLTGEGRA